eukprot:symbB.v1.2.012315.t1/scaffold846.1/size158211/1
MPACYGRNQVRRLSELMNTLSPGFAKALLHSRDSHMTKLLRSKTFASERTVCVVGMAHMDGIVMPLVFIVLWTSASIQEDPPWQAPKPRSRQDQANLSRLLEQELKNFKLHDMYRGWGQLHAEYSSERSSLTEGDWPHAPFYDPKVDPISRLSYWLELAEHFRFPHILHFASLPEMIDMVLHTVRWPEVSVQLRAHHRRVVMNSEEQL